MCGRRHPGAIVRAWCAIKRSGGSPGASARVLLSHVRVPKEFLRAFFPIWTLATLWTHSECPSPQLGGPRSPGMERAAALSLQIARAHDQMARADLVFASSKLTRLLWSVASRGGPPTNSDPQAPIHPLLPRVTWADFQTHVENAQSSLDLLLSESLDELRNG